MPDYNCRVGLSIFSAGGHTVTGFLIGTPSGYQMLLNAAFFWGHSVEFVVVFAPKNLGIVFYPTF